MTGTGILKDATGIGDGEPANRIFGTSYFLFLKYDVYAGERNIARYAKEIRLIRDLLAQGESALPALTDALNRNKGERRYHPRTTRRMLDTALRNFTDPRATEDDRLLIALTYWQICRLKKVPSVMAFLMKGLKGGRSFEHSFLDRNGDFTCVDTAAVTAALCEALGIAGEIRNDGLGSVMGLHHFFETEDGRIVDVPFGLREGGFFFDGSTHPRTVVVVARFLRSTARRAGRRLARPFLLVAGVTVLPF